MDRSKPLISLFVIAAFILAQVPFALAGWVAVFPAPSGTGVYNVIIQATHNGVTDTITLPLTVSNTLLPEDNLTVTSVYPIGRTAPITLRYDIKLNGSKTFEMVSNQLNVYYVSGNDVLLKSEDMALVQQSDGYWYTIVNVPFKGAYEAHISLVVRKNGTMYGRGFVIRFTADSTSPDLAITTSLSKRVLNIGDTFNVSLEALFEGSPLTNLELFKANLYGQRWGLLWNPAEYRYEHSFDAPSAEGIYLLSAYAENQDFIHQEKIYVADTTKQKSARCPFAVGATGGCTDMKDVRRCVADYRNNVITVPESQIIDCFESAQAGLIQGAIYCDKTGNNRGDLDGDNETDVDDLDVLQNMILPLTDSQRQDYVKCADYDRNGVVDEKDLQCMTNVVSGKWYGDKKGGICLDAKYDSPLKCDLNGDDFITAGDRDILDKLIEANTSGVNIPLRILSACDFNNDTKLTQGGTAANPSDRMCLTYFLGMDFDNPDTLLAAGRTIPKDCLKIYDLDKCQSIKIKGDLNGDIVIDAIDEILIMLINAHQINTTDYSGLMYCADVNGEGDGVTNEDVICVKSYTQGDRDAYFTCIGCNDTVPAAYRYTSEICNDGIDNDCNGLIDRTNAIPRLDECNCNVSTPCFMIRDADGVPGISDMNIQVCRKASWAASSSIPGIDTTTFGYKWMKPEELTCKADRSCGTVECDESLYKCAFNGATWNWYDSPYVNLPTESDEKPLCGDGYDNDCCGGDHECKEKKGMFKKWQFWVGLVAGVALSFFVGPAALVVWSLITSVGGQYAAKSKAEWAQDLAAGLSGFGLGAALGGLGQAAYSIGSGTAAMPGTLAGESSYFGVGITSASSTGFMYGLTATQSAVLGSAALLIATGAGFSAANKHTWEEYDATCSAKGSV